MPVVDQVASDYLDEIAFVAVAGRSDMGRTAEVADGLCSDNLQWGLDDSVWDTYGVRGQPTSVLVSQGIVVDVWFGAIGDAAIRDRLDRLVSISS